MSERGISRRAAIAAGAAGLGGLTAAGPAAAAASGRWWPGPGGWGPGGGRLPAGTVMIIRHGEKPSTTSPPPPYGVTAAGTEDTASLTTTGWARAGALVQLFAPAATPIRPGLARPASVFASNQSGPAGGSAREVETVSFVSGQLGLTTDAQYGVGDESALVAALPGSPGPVLICWEHDHIPTIADDLGTVTPAVPQTWPSDRFDLVWLFVPAGAPQRYRFLQVPQLLLSGDSAEPIA